LDKLSVLAVLAVLSLFGLVVGAFKLGRMSRPTTTLRAAHMDSETMLYVDSEVWPRKKPHYTDGFEDGLSSLDELHVELGERKVAAKGWEKMPPRGPDGRFLKKQVG
jgi:hypothetical protein